MNFARVKKQSSKQIFQESRMYMGVHVAKYMAEMNLKFLSY